MLKKIVSLAGILLLFSFYPVIVSGQYIVHYCSGCVSNGLCTDREFSTCQEAEASGRLACPAGGWWVESKFDCGPKPNPNPINIKSPGANGFYGALLGGLLGSLRKDPNGKVLWDLGAAGGFAFFSGITIIAEPKSRAMGPNIVLGMLVCGTTAYAGARVWPLINKPDTPKTPAEVTKETLIAGGAGAIGGVIIGALTARPGKANSISRTIRKSKLLSNTAFTFNGSRVGIVIRF